jgi:hypothetical protein
MTQISNLTSSMDTRDNWKRVSRRQLWKGGKKLGVALKPGAKHSEMVDIFQRGGFTPEQIVNFVPVQVPDGDGTTTKTVMYPEQHERKFDEHKEHKRMELFEQRIADATEAENKRMAEEKAKMEQEKNAEISGLKSEVEELKALMKQMLERGMQNESEVKSVKNITDLNKMHWKSFQKLAKEAGIEWSTKDPRGPVIEKLEAQDGKDAA